MENDEPTIENKLKDLRKEHKLSQEELADQLGVSRQSIIALEQGKYLPSLPLVVSLCKFFHSPFEDIFIFEIEIEDEIVNLAESDHYFEDNVIMPKTVGVMPKIDIKDAGSHLIVKAELPGMEEEEIDVEIADGIMTISGQKEESHSAKASRDGEEEVEEVYFHKESHTGKFSRSFTLPSEVVAEKAEAEMKNGVLTIKLPKIEPRKATKVKIAPKKKIKMQ